MKTSLYIARHVEGTIDELMAPLNLPPAPTIAEVTTSLRELAFIVEAVANLQGKEAQLLPTAEKARKLIARLEE